MTSDFRCIEIVLFFKQKTAYKLRISDWSSGVCSSDLMRLAADTHFRGAMAAALLRQHHQRAFAGADDCFGRNEHRLAPRGRKRHLREHARPQPQVGIAQFGADGEGAALGLRTGQDRGDPAGEFLAREGSQCRARSEEHTSELQSLMRISYAVFCLKKKTNKTTT